MAFGVFMIDGATVISVLEFLKFGFGTGIEEI